MIRRIFSYLLLFVFLFVYPAHAHPGSLDENGGHYNHSTGEYHYHEGTNDDYTPSSRPYYDSGPLPSQTKAPARFSVDPDLINGFSWVGMMVVVFALLFLVCCFSISRSPKRKSVRSDSKSVPVQKPSGVLSEAANEAHNLNRLSGIEVKKSPPPSPPPVSVKSSAAIVPLSAPEPKPEPIVPAPSKDVVDAVPPSPPIPPVSSLPPLAPEPSEADIPNVPVLYRQNYPHTWSYIQRHSKNAHSYVYYYHYVWGELQAHHGDGIIYGTLTPEEQSLVNYPIVGNIVYLSSDKSDVYHSTPNCYSLIRSTPIEADAVHTIVRKRCTKCVPPHSSK